MTQDVMSLSTSRSGEYVLKFEVREHSVRADILANAISSCDAVIRNASKFSLGLHDVNVEVSALRPGSVEVNLRVSASHDDENVDSVAMAVGVIPKTLDVFKFLKGEPIRSAEMSENDVVLQNKDGERIAIAQSLYKNLLDTDVPPFGDCTCYNEDDITTISLLDAQTRHEIARLDYKDFKYMRPQVISLSNTENREKIENCDLRIATIPLNEPKNQWVFIHRTTKIAAKIKDEKFLESVNKSVHSFGRGDCLKVILRSIEPIGASGMGNEKIRYDILKVLEVIHAPKQMLLGEGSVVL